MDSDTQGFNLVTDINLLNGKYGISVISTYEVGSFLYGLNTDTSDHDYSGVFLPMPIKLLNPLYTPCEEIDCGIKSKDCNNKNDSNAVDFKLYSFDKFLKLVYGNNPNMVEHLNIINFFHIDDRFKIIVENKDLFVNKNVFNKFIGYALSQERKMYIKSENVVIIDRLYTFMTNNIKYDNPHPIVTDYDLVSFITNNFGVKSKVLDNNNTDGYFTVGDMEFPLNKSIKEMYAHLKTRYNNATNRKDGILNKGYDTKFASHCVRLLIEGIELAMTKEIKFPLSERNLLMDIKLGNYSIKEVSQIINHYKHKFEEVESQIKLPNYGNKIIIDKISELILKVYKKQIDELVI